MVVTNKDAAVMDHSASVENESNCENYRVRFEKKWCAIGPYKLERVGTELVCVLESG